MEIEEKIKHLITNFFEKNPNRNITQKELVNIVINVNKMKKKFSNFEIQEMKNTCETIISKIIFFIDDISTKHTWTDIVYRYNK